MRICALGDLLVDVVARPDAPWRHGDDVHATVGIGVGGQAANVAAWAARLGAAARLVAVRADDPAGALVAGELARRGVEVCGPLVAGRTGAVVALLDGSGERAMLSDRGVSPDFVPEQLEADWFADVDRLHVTGYALIAEPMAFTAMAAARLAREAGARVSVDLSAAHLIRRLGGAAFRRRLAVVAPDLLFGTAAEFAALDGPVDAPVLVVKRGASGCTVQWPGGRQDVPAPDVEVVDTTGAGDAFAAGFLLGTDRDDAVARARQAAGACLGTMGAMPPDEETPR